MIKFVSNTNTITEPLDSLISDLIISCFLGSASTCVVQLRTVIIIQNSYWLLLWFSCIKPLDKPEKVDCCNGEETLSYTPKLNQQVKHAIYLKINTTAA